MYNPSLSWSLVLKNIRSVVLLVLYLSIGIVGSNSQIPSYETVVQEVQEKLSYLEQKSSDLKASEMGIAGVTNIVQTEIPAIQKILMRLNEKLMSDKYFGKVRESYKVFSDPLKELWTKVNRTAFASHRYFTGVTNGISKLTKSYIQLMREQTDQDTNPLTDEFKSNLTALLHRYISHTFRLAKAGSEQNLDLTALEKQCQALAVEVTEYEANKQISKRIRRSAAKDRKSVACTKGDWQSSHGSEIVIWIEDMRLRIPATVSFAVLTCYELQATESIIQFLLFLASEDLTSLQLQKLQEKEMDLTLTAVWIRGKFHNRTLEQKKVTDSAGTRLVVEGKGGTLSEAADIWTCDPEQYVVGDNVIRFSGVYQTCIVKEGSLNGDGSCWEKCKHYSQPHSPELDYVAARSVCQTKQCKKDLKTNLGLFHSKVQCKRLEGKVKICPSRSRDERYTWFSVGSERYGKKAENDSCDSDIQTVQEDWVMEDGMLMTSPQFCEVCLCSCNHAGIGKSAIAYVSAYEAVADAERNMVVTGIRFETEHGIIFIAIETGQLRGDGTIDPSSLYWESPELKSSTVKFDRRSVLKLNYDFQKLHLDDIESINHGFGSENYALTGVRLRHHKDHLALEARMTQFDETTKVLNVNSSVWLNRLDDHEVRKVLSYEEADSPVETPSPSVPDSDFRQAVQFSSASLTKTAGQIVVPYLDGQNVVPPVRSVLRGVGLFHKGQPGYGGFIAFRLLVLQPR